jgi:hypothetical protein
MARLRRVTLDWDFKNPLKCCWYFYKILKTDFQKVEMRKSRSKGYHVYLWTYAKGKKRNLRITLGDDKKHVRMDDKHKTAKQTLFNKKRKNSFVRLRKIAGIKTRYNKNFKFE